MAQCGLAIGQIRTVTLGTRDTGREHYVKNAKSAAVIRMMAIEAGGLEGQRYCNQGWISWAAAPANETRTGLAQASDANE